MNYCVFHESKFVSVFSELVQKNELKQYADKGYQIAYFIRGNTPVVDIMRGIVMNRCTQD